jgi:nucleotide-binding universal stress UspA family protein
MFQAKRILVAVDFSDESSLARDWAIMLAKTQPGASITLCHVLNQTMSPVGPDAMVFVQSDQEERMAKARMEEWKQHIPSEIPARVIVTQGPPASEIIRVAEKERSQLILLTTHGRRGLSRVLHGSVSEEVVRTASCPVLVLHLTRSTLEAVHETAMKE